MILSIQLNHGRLAMKEAEVKKLARFLGYAGDVEIRIAGRCILISDEPPLKLIEPRRRRKKYRRKK